MQALLLMNDPQYLEAARFFAQTAIDECDNSTERAIFIYQTALGRAPTDVEMSIVTAQHESDLAAFNSNLDEAKNLTEIGEVAADKKYNVAELASWTLIASLIMNTDEFVSKN